MIQYHQNKLCSVAFSSDYINSIDNNVSENLIHIGQFKQYGTHYTSLETITTILMKDTKK